MTQSIGKRLRMRRCLRRVCHRCLVMIILSSPKCALPFVYVCAHSGRCTLLVEGDGEPRRVTSVCALRVEDLLLCHRFRAITKKCCRIVSCCAPSAISRSISLSLYLYFSCVFSIFPHLAICSDSSPLSFLCAFSSLFFLSRLSAFCSFCSLCVRSLSLSLSPLFFINLVLLLFFFFLFLLFLFFLFFFFSSSLSLSICPFFLSLSSCICLFISLASPHGFSNTIPENASKSFP